jgi:hypothetical protein
VGGIISLWWAASFRYGGRHHLVMMGGLDRNQHSIRIEKSAARSGEMMAPLAGLLFNQMLSMVEIGARQIRPQPKCCLA